MHDQQTSLKSVSPNSGSIPGHFTTCPQACFKCRCLSSPENPYLDEKSALVSELNTDDCTTNEIGKSRPASVWRRCLTWLATLAVDTSRSGYNYWIGLVSFTVVFNAIVLPMRSAFTQFHDLSYQTWMFLDFSIDVINLVDIFIGARTCYLDQGLLVTDTTQLRKAYLKRRDLIFDVIAVLPTDLLYLVPQVNHHAAWLRLNRLAKAYRLFDFIDRTETHTTRPNVFRIAMLAIHILTLIHWNACIYFGFSTASGLGTNSFVYPPRSSDEITNTAYNYSDRWNLLFSKYIYSFYWSTLILTTIGETPKPVNNREYIFLTIDFLVGVLIFATIVGNVGAMITNMNAARTDFQNRMDGVKRYMEFRKVDKVLELRVIRWFDYLWSNKQSLEEDVLDTLPEKLKAEIAIHVHFETLKRVNIFKDCDPGLLMELVLKLRLQIFSPGDYICRKGDIGKEMYIVKRGKLSVVSDDGKTVFVTLSEGSVFGEISILDIAGNKTGNRRSANVRSVGYSDLFCLSKDDLWDALTEYPEAKEILMRKGEEMLRKDNLLDEEVLRKAQEKKETIEQAVSRIDSSLNQINTRLARLIGEFGASQAKTKRRLSRLEEFAVCSEESPNHPPPTQGHLCLPRKGTVATDFHQPERSQDHSDREASNCSSLSSLGSNTTCGTIPDS